MNKIKRFFNYQSYLGSDSSNWGFYYMDSFNNKRKHGQKYFISDKSKFTGSKYNDIFALYISVYYEDL